MYQEISQLLMYGDLDEDSILAQMGEVFGKYETGEYNKTGLVRDINTQVKRILKVATDYGFDDNLWHNYLTFFLMMSENPFSMTCEKVGASDGSVNELVENDFRIFKDLFDYDFGPIEKDLGINCFSQISNYLLLPTIKNSGLLSVGYCVVLTATLVNSILSKFIKLFFSF